MNRTKRPRNELTVSQKQEICRFYQKHPTLTIKALQDHFSNSFGSKIGHSTIGTILKRAEHWNSIEFPDNVRRTHSTTFANMEKEVFEWICSSSKPVLDAEIVEKVMELVEKTDIQNEWKSQRGWLNSFKRRFNLVLRREDSKPIGYIAGKMPAMREPLHRIKAPLGRRSTRNISKGTTKGTAEIPTSGTNSIIYDAALGNFLQDDGGDDDDDDDDDDDLNSESVDNSGHSDQTGMQNMVTDEPKTGISTSPSKITASTEIPRPSKELPVDKLETSIEGIAEMAGTSQPSQNCVPSSTSYTFPVVFRSAEAESSVPIFSAQKAMSTLLSFFKQNSDTSQQDLEHLKALDVRLKYLSAKEAVSTLKAHLMANEPSRNEADLQYLSNLEQRL